MFAAHAPAIIEHKPENLRGFKHHVALLTLPRLCGTTRETIPMMPGFFRRPDQIPDHLKIQRQPFALHIGLVWASGADNKDMYADKSMDLEPLMSLFDDWREERLVVLHSLQVGSDASQLDPWRTTGIVDHQSIDDFYNCMCDQSIDLVITLTQLLLTWPVPWMCRCGPCCNTTQISVGCEVAVIVPGIDR